MDIFVSSSCIIFFIFVLLTNFPTSLCRLSKEFKSCNQPFNCGNMRNISYPFYGFGRPSYCGHPGFELFGCDQVAKPITLVMKSQTFDVMNINYAKSVVTIAREDFRRKSGCPDSLENITVDFSIFEYTPLDANLTLFYGNCSSLCNSTSFGEFGCPMSPTNVPFCWLTKNAMIKNNISEDSCPHHLFLPIHVSDNSEMDGAGGYIPSSAWNGFELKWSANNGLCEACTSSGGRCGHDPRSKRFFCFCTDESKCPFPGSSSKKARLTKSRIAILVSAIGMAVLVVLGFYLKGRCSTKEVDSNWKRLPDVEALLQNHGAVGLQTFTYSDLEKITNSFGDRLGEGRYGVMFKGKLPDTGHLVAVRILKKSIGNAEDFISEVASIGKTNHVNIVTLLGFCYEGKRRALVYDFMPNGSLNKYLYGTNDIDKLLSWKEMFQIAVGVAKGLDYLHRGCNKRMLNFGIKPHNILLDEKFCPKISDFGLARLCPQNERIILTPGGGGNVGYVAPEVFLRSFGGVSYKSDVYSYGMLVLDMVGCRKKADCVGDQCSREYFPQWIYEQLEVKEVPFDDQTKSSEEIEIQKKLILVSLWCVKANPSSRPEMSKVVEMLEGAAESFQVPRISSPAG